MKEYEISDLNEHQLNTLEVLCDIGGWATSKQLQYHGVNHSSADALVSRGFVERRAIANSPYQTPEWRIKLEKLPDMLELVPADSIYGLFVRANSAIYSICNEIIEVQQLDILDSANPDVKH